MNMFQGTGNLGSDPELKQVEVNGEEKTIVELRVYFDRVVPAGDGDFKDKGGFWRNVTIWKESLGERVTKHLVSGSKVFIIGQQVSNNWNDEHGQKRESYTIAADYVAADLIGIEAINYAKKAA